MIESPDIREFLYFCPDTGMTICMIQDGAGFKPATVDDEYMSIPASHFDNQSVSPSVTSNDYESLDSFVSNYERSFAPGSP